MATTDTTWYIGPAGGLVAIPDPEVGGVSRTRNRVQSASMGASGAATINLHGVKRQWSLRIEALTIDQAALLNGLNSGIVAGPLRLVDPMSKNLLTARVASTYSSPDWRNPFALVSGSLTPLVPAASDSTFPISPRHRSVASFVNGSGGTTEVAASTYQAVIPGASYTLSAYIKPTASCFLRLYGKDASGATSTLASVAAGTTGSWNRYSLSHSPAGSIVEVRMGVSVPAGATTLLAAPQLELGAISGWVPGDDVPFVEVQGLTEDAPFYPYTDATLTLVEL